MRFFNHGLSNRNYLLIAFVCLTSGLLLGWLRLYLNQVALQDYTKYISRYRIPFNMLFPFERILTAIGYASLVITMIKINKLQHLWRALAAAGKMALTCYLLQSLLCTLFFTGFGMGYYGMLKQYQLYFVAAEIVLLEIVFCICWLKVYQLGPSEWLLRCLTHGKWLPNKIINQPSTAINIPALY
ncbi:MAG: DUF418 domain-containing protein [Chitinophagaceae bacterium]